MKEKINISKNEMINLLYVEKLTHKEIALKFNISRSAVLRKMKKYNLTSIENWQRKCPEDISDFQKEVLYGSLLGDDCIYHFKSSRYSSLIVYHSFSNLDYTWLKYNIFKNFATSEPKIRIRNKGRRVTFSTVCHPCFEETRKEYYDKNNMKHINDFILSRLTPISLAFWFGDDGSRCKNGGLAIHTNCFSFSEVELACNWFKNKYGIICYPQERSENQWVIFFSNKTSYIFAELICQYLHPSMRYKLQGVYNHIKNPQRLNVIPFSLQEYAKSKSQSELYSDIQNSNKE